MSSPPLPQSLDALSTRWDVQVNTRETCQHVNYYTWLQNERLSLCDLWMVQGAKIQLLDLPGIIEGAKDGKGRGRQVRKEAKSVNISKHITQILSRLLQSPGQQTSSSLSWTCWNHLGTRRSWRMSWRALASGWTRRRPTSSSRRRTRGGSTCRSWCRSLSSTSIWLRRSLRNTGKKLFHAFCSIYLVRISNADITLRCDATVDDLIDVVEGNRRVFLSKFLTFLWKSDVDLFFLQELHTLHLLA